MISIKKDPKFKFTVNLRNCDHFDSLVKYMCRRAGRTAEHWTIEGGRKTKRKLLDGHVPLVRIFLVFSPKFTEDDLAIIKLL